MTDKGKELVRDHESDSDAQAVYKKLQEHHLTSTKAMIDSSTILSYIKSEIIGYGEWKGTTESFIRHWKNQVRLYERQIDKKDHFSDALKRTMLENAVHPIADLRQVKSNADLEKERQAQNYHMTNKYHFLHNQLLHMMRTISHEDLKGLCMLMKCKMMMVNITMQMSMKMTYMILICLFLLSKLIPMTVVDLPWSRNRLPILRMSAWPVNDGPS